MFPHILLLSLPLLTIGEKIIPPLGVPPELRAMYTPSSSSPPTWKCLSGDGEILWTEINDDFCDCPDGSDEPGTSACPDTTFYCANEGHIGVHISKTKVHDGKCAQSYKDQECCDGSDELAGICPNVCKEIGEVHRVKIEAERKIRKTGSKIRSSYVAFAQKEKKRLEDSVSLLEKEAMAREKEVARLQDVMNRVESLSASALEHKKQSPLYQSLLTHHLALKSLRKAHSDILKKEKQLGDILETLKSGYNPNYQDMAVLEAVRGWEALSTTKDDDKGAADEQLENTASSDEEFLTGEQLDDTLDELSGQDHVALLFGHEAHVARDSTALLFNISSYLPEELVPRYISLRDTVVGWLRNMGVVPEPIDSSDETSQARAAFAEAESKLNSVKAQKRRDQEELKKLFEVEGFGPEGEWKKLQGLCLSKDTGEYTYEVCLFGDATQNQGGIRHSLGKFSSWSTNPDVKPGDPRYYQTQHYTKGAKCWNGPERSITLHLSCGTENALLTIAEPEKCEYHLTGTTPALCLPPEAETKREEL